MFGLGCFETDGKQSGSKVGAKCFLAVFGQKPLSNPLEFS